MTAKDHFDPAASPDQKAADTGTEPTIKFRDENCGPVLEISARDLAEQWLANLNEWKADTAKRHGEAFTPEKFPENPLQWVVNGIKSRIEHERGRPWDMHDDPEMDPSYMQAKIDGRGVQMVLKDFVTLNADIINGGRPGQKPRLSPR